MVVSKQTTEYSYFFKKLKNPLAILWSFVSDLMMLLKALFPPWLFDPFPATTTWLLGKWDLMKLATVRFVNSHSRSALFRITWTGRSLLCVFSSSGTKYDCRRLLSLVIA